MATRRQSGKKSRGRNDGLLPSLFGGGNRRSSSRGRSNKPVRSGRSSSSRSKGRSSRSMSPKRTRGGSRSSRTRQIRRR